MPKLFFEAFVFVVAMMHPPRLPGTDLQVPTEKLLVPDVCFDDFMKALTKSGSSVSPEELTRFVKWTEDFGQEG